MLQAEVFLKLHKDLEDHLLADVKQMAVESYKVMNSSMVVILAQWPHMASSFA